MKFTNSGQFKKGQISINKGKALSEEHRKKLSLALQGRTAWNKGKNGYTTKRKGMKHSEETKKKLLEFAKKGALKRWENHIKVDKKYQQKYKYKHMTYAEKYKGREDLMEKKRFTNQRYKARKQNALGSHTFEEWENLKIFYKFMCLCCKRQEPEIKLTEDHIMPLSMGGSDFIDNIQPLCQSCNTRKSTKYISYAPRSNSLIYGAKGE